MAPARRGSAPPGEPPVIALSPEPAPAPTGWAVSGLGPAAGAGAGPGAELPLAEDRPSDAGSPACLSSWRGIKRRKAAPVLCGPHLPLLSPALRGRDSGHAAWAAIPLPTARGGQAWGLCPACPLCPPAAVGSLRAEGGPGKGGEGEDPRLGLAGAGVALMEPPGPLLLRPLQARAPKPRPPTPSRAAAAVQAWPSGRADRCPDASRASALHGCRLRGGGTRQCRPRGGLIQRCVRACVRACAHLRACATACMCSYAQLCVRTWVHV